MSARDAGGFDAVLSNPPWDIMQPNTAEFFAGFDLVILDARASARRMRSRIGCWPILGWRLRGAAISASSCGSIGWWKGFISIRGLVRDGTVMGGKLDLYRVFAEENATG